MPGVLGCSISRSRFSASAKEALHTGKDIRMGCAGCVFLVPDSPPLPRKPCTQVKT